MKCNYCQRVILSDQQTVRVTHGEEEQVFHATPQPGEEMSCWQWEVHMQAFSLSVTNDAIRAGRNARASAA